MQLKDLVDLYMKLNERLAFFWNFYIVSTIGLLTLYFTQIKEKTPPIKGVFILAYLVLVALNMNALFEINKLQIATTAELKRQANLNSDSSAFIRAFCFRNPSQERKLMLLPHLLSGSVVMALLLLAK